MNADVVASPMVSASPRFTFQKPRNAATSMTVVGTKRTCRRGLMMSVHGAKADIERIGRQVWF
jgi:hypothetical protein